MSSERGGPERPSAPEAEVAPRASDERYRLALEASGHAYFEFDARSARVLAGAPWTAAGYAAEDLSPSFEEWLLLVHADDRAALLEAVERQRRGAAVTRIEYRVRAKAGGWRSLLVSTRVLTRDADGEPIRVVGTMTDVTEARALRERLLATDRLASLGSLAVGVAHAVNGPLATVASSLRALQEELERFPTDATGAAGAAARVPELRQAAADAAQGAESVREVVRALQIFAAPRTACREPVDARGELEAAITLTRNAVAQRARLAVEMPPALPRVIAAPGELGQAFLNLLLDAAQAIPEGRPAENEVRVAARADGGRVVIEVRDTGPGVDPANLSRACEPSFAVRPASGAGLGLSVCRAVVAAAGGSVEVESADGRGAVFRVSLPATPTALRAEEAPAAQGGAAPAPRGRVLVVDDDPLVGRSLARLLRGAHEVTVLTSPVEAVAAVERGERWDAILCDLMMPELPGMDVEARLAACAPELVGRVVYLTGGAFTERARQFLAAGRPYLEKPVDAAILRERVAEVVRRCSGTRTTSESAGSLPGRPPPPESPARG